MYYGNPALPSQQNAGEVWNNSYTGIWHLNEPSGVHHDSVTDLENGIIHGTVNQNMSEATGESQIYEQLFVGDLSAEKNCQEVSERKERGDNF